MTQEEKEELKVLHKYMCCPNCYGTRIEYISTNYDTFYWICCQCSRDQQEGHNDPVEALFYWHINPKYEQMEIQ